MLFWICAAVLLGIAVFWLSRPLNASNAPKLESAHERIIAIAKERRNEIQSSLDTGDLTPQEHTQAMADLESALADELSTSNELGEAKSSPPNFSSAAILLCVPLIALGMYALTGTSDYQFRAEQAKAQAAANKQAEAVPSLEQLVDGLEARLQENPTDERGLFLLGQTYSRIGRHAEAADTYSKLLSQVGPNADLLVEQADAMAMNNNQAFTQDSYALLTQAIDLDPHHVKGRWLIGIADMGSGLTKQALEHWLWAKEQLRDDPAGSAQITQLIDNARQQLGDQAKDAEALILEKITKHNQSAEHLATVSEIQQGGDTATANSSDAIALQIQVSLGDNINAEVNPEDTVFIFAKARSGPKAPLAVQRVQVADLPITVTLDDSNAMLPQFKLSLFEEVTVSARISKTGEPIAQSGDIETKGVDVMLPYTETISLSLSNVVK